MGRQAHHSFDFNQWSRLAREDPAAFEQERERIIDQAILRTPEPKRQRLRCLQWRIDQARRQSANPMSACLRLSRMMWDSVLQENGLQKALQGLDSIADDDPTVRLLPVARVLPFRRRDEPPRA